MKIIEISKCWECPYFGSSSLSNNWCVKYHNTIENPKKLPSWCKLEDISKKKRSARIVNKCKHQHGRWCHHPNDDIQDRCDIWNGQQLCNKYKESK